MTIPFIGKLKIDGVETYTDANSVSYTTGLPDMITNVLVSGSATKVTITPDYTNARSTVNFSIRINADEGKVNPVNLFYALKFITTTEITLLPDNGFGGFIFRNMTLKNDISTGLSPDSSVSFSFEGQTAVKL